MTRLVSPYEFDRDLTRLRRLLSDWAQLYAEAHDVSLTGAGQGLATIPQRGTVSDSTGSIVGDPRKAAIRQALKEAHAAIDVAHQALLRSRNGAQYAMGMRRRGWDVAEAQAAEARAARRRHPRSVNQQPKPTNTQVSGA